MAMETITAGGSRMAASVAALPGVEQIRSFAKLERVLAGLCLLIPLLLICFDVGPESVRDSISAYHNMTRAQVFFVPLTVAAMLFVVNGVIKTHRVYNTLLGLTLIGVTLFDHDGSSKWIHYIFAAAFFGGNALVILWFSFRENRPMRYRVIFAVAIALSMLGVLLDWFSLFWAEWVSLAMISVHYILDSWERSGYTIALAPDLASTA